MQTSAHPVAGVDYPRNWHELLAWFPDDAACLRYLERLRWAEGFTCRFCGTVEGGWWQMADGLRRCTACRRETSVTAGTILAGTRMPLVSWFAAVWYVVNQKQGVSALGLQRVLGFGSYQTAWAWLHKLRRAMVCPDRELLDGVVEVDETILGGVKAGRRGRGAPGKALVAIAVERRAGGPGRTRMRRIPDASKDVLTDFVLDQVQRQRGPHRRLGRLQRRRRAPLHPRRDERLGLRRPRARRDARGPPRRQPAQALAAGNPPGRRQPRPARLLPRRVHLPLQPSPLPPPRAALLPPARAGHGDRPAPLQDPQGPRKWIPHLENCRKLYFDEDDQPLRPLAKPPKRPGGPRFRIVYELLPSDDRPTRAFVWAAGAKRADVYSTAHGRRNP